MKTRQKKQAQAAMGLTDPPMTTPAQPKALSLSQALNASFDIAVSRFFPEEYGEPDDRELLRAVWMLGYQSAAEQILASTISPIRQTAKSEFEKLVPSPPIVPA